VYGPVSRKEFFHFLEKKESNPMPEMIARIPVTILNGASLSNAVPLYGGLPAVIEMPAAWTAAVLTFQTSGDNTNFFNVYDDAGSEVSITTDASRRIRLEPTQWAGISQIKIRSGTAGAAVNQGGDRILYLEVWE
jgi:hypothetical protein